MSNRGQVVDLRGGGRARRWAGAARRARLLMSDRAREGDQKVALPMRPIWHPDGGIQRWRE